eukprot:SAG11_NODE_10201_length_847_cov_1.983957_1_plen_134_part_00
MRLVRCGRLLRYKGHVVNVVLDLAEPKNKIVALQFGVTVPPAPNSAHTATAARAFSDGCARTAWLLQPTANDLPKVRGIEYSPSDPNGAVHADVWIPETAFSFTGDRVAAQAPRLPAGPPPAPILFHRGGARP